MAFERITRLALRDAADWERLSAHTRELVAAAAELPEVESLRLVRVDDVSAVLVLGVADASSLEAVGNGVVDAWLAERVRPLLAEGWQTESGEVLITLHRASSDASDELAGLGPGERLGSFVRSAAQTQTVWGLYGETWARAPRADGSEALPFWPSMELAARCVGGEWAECVPRRIDLDAFLEQWLGGMEEDGIVAVICPTPDHPGLAVAPGDLEAALRHASK